MAAALFVANAGAASAADPGWDSETLHSMEACYDPGSSKFKFTLWYNSGQNGAYRNMHHPIYNFDALRPGDGADHPLKYCGGGGSSPWPGSYQRVKNNAASGENFHYKYTARVYFRSGFGGAQDVMGPYQHIDQFRNVYNNNASFQFTS
ncbi:hypothetical protein QWM81_26885 [Streptomyces ficellus]|uniref:Secreted protein n=1 Tax=Streptomyces ficellus TaxID=1977088 RepID=A0ABT7ZDK9_9ACTN|nr:hypothetical protein [Streptomyces ficellus]MDN3297598.1 hypothetical protein [Streptomyces ficellus]